MMKKYYELLTTDILIKASDLIPKINDRTLLYGFDNDTKEKFHVFLKGQEIYAFRGTKPVKIKHNFQFVQNVTLYPEACDFTSDHFTFPSMECKKGTGSRRTE